MPPNFSAMYGLAFCAGALFGRRGWRAPLVFVVVTDLALDAWYQFHLGWRVFNLVGLAGHAFNLAGYAALFGVGRWMRGRGETRPGWLASAVGSVLGAILFYVITNTASWWFNPFGNAEYTRTLAGWWTALTRGAGGWPETWEFFRNSLLSAGLFGGLFAAAWKAAAAAESPVEKGEAAPVPEREPQEAEA